MRLSDVESVSLVDRRGYLTVVVGIMGEDNMLVRRPENVREWYNMLQRTVKESKARMFKTTEPVLTTERNSEKMQDWEAGRSRVDGLYQGTTAKTLSMDRRGSRQKRRGMSECK